MFGKEDNETGRKLYLKALSDFDWRVILADRLNEVDKIYIPK